MQLVLCSEGFHTPNTVQACVDLVGKPQNQISVAVINEAFAVEDNDKRWVLHNLSCAADNFSGRFDIVDLLALSLEEVERRITKCDVIFVVGGNPDYLMHVFQKTGFSKLLPKLLKTKVYAGSSAGSMVVGKRMSKKAYQVMYGLESTYGITEYLKLVDFSIMPHLESKDFPNRKEDLLEAVKHHAGLVYGLKDDAAVVVDGDTVRTIGSDPVKIEHGKVLDSAN